MKNQLAKKIAFSGILLGSLLFTVNTATAQSSSALVRDYPQSYTVKEGDTLWQIAGNFLQDPADWQKMWMPSPYLKDDNIYPGDVISVEFFNGRPKLVSQKSNLTVEFLTPQMREIATTGSIPAIPLDSIYNSFTTNRIVPLEVYDVAPYILSPLGKGLVIGAGDEVYARGDWPEGSNSFEIYRQINSFQDPQSNESLGTELATVGFATVTGIQEDGIRKMQIISSNRDIQVGDRLLIREETRMDPTIYPNEPSQQIRGSVIAMTNTERMASQLDTVLLNVGAQENLALGDILSLHQPGNMIADETDEESQKFTEQFASFLSNPQVQLPSTKIGTILIYKVFDKLSYGVILSSSEPTTVGDLVVNP